MFSNLHEPGQHQIYIRNGARRAVCGYQSSRHSPTVPLQSYSQVPKGFSAHRNRNSERHHGNTCPDKRARVKPRKARHRYPEVHQNASHGSHTFSHSQPTLNISVSDDPGEVVFCYEDAHPILRIVRNRKSPPRRAPRENPVKDPSQTAHPRSFQSRYPNVSRSPVNSVRFKEDQLTPSMSGSYSTPTARTKSKWSDSKMEPNERYGPRNAFVPNTSSAYMQPSVSTKIFPYQKLQSNKDIRLVRVLPETSSKLTCSIFHASVDHPPSYIAISYAWGDKVDTKSLFLEGVELQVSASLHGALRAIRKQDKGVLIWADQLCINQGDKSERKQQVQLMGTIYSHAKFVAVWLGADTENSQYATDLLERVKQNKVSSRRITDIERRDSAALKCLLEREYWHRLWVVQEVFLARKIWVYCGSSKLPWRTYEVASNAFWEHESNPYLRQGPSSFPTIGSLAGEGAFCLLKVLRACRKKISKDPLDKIFGILGMLQFETRRELPVKYDQAVKTLYIRVADLIITSTRSLDIIRESIHFPCHNNQNDVPTWCPDCVYLLYLTKHKAFTNT